MKTSEEYVEIGRKAYAEYMAAHNGEYAGEDCRCDYCKRVFCKFIQRMDASQ